MNKPGFQVIDNVMQSNYQFSNPGPRCTQSTNLSCYKQKRAALKSTRDAPRAPLRGSKILCSPLHSVAIQTFFCKCAFAHPETNRKVGEPVRVSFSNCTSTSPEANRKACETAQTARVSKFEFSASNEHYFAHSRPRVD